MIIEAGKENNRPTEARELSFLEDDSALNIREYAGEWSAGNLMNTFNEVLL